MKRSSSTISRCALLLLWLSAAALAKGGDLQRHLARADRLYAERKYEEALPELQAAYRQRPLPRIMYNLAQTYRNLQRPREALEHLALYLRAERSPAPEEQAKIRGQEVALRAALREQCALAEREGATTLAQGDPLRARATLSQALDSRQYLQRSDPTQVQYLRDLVIAHLRLAQLEQAQRDPAATRDHLTAAEAALVQVEQTPAQVDALLLKMRQQLAALKLSTPSEPAPK